MRPHELRVYEERMDLQDKIVKARRFTVSAEFVQLENEDAQLLFQQITAMEAYCAVLTQRINRFQKRAA